jgi:hypothetical protein
MSRSRCVLADEPKANDCCRANNSGGRPAAPRTESFHKAFSTDPNSQDSDGAAGQQSLPDRHTSPGRRQAARPRVRTRRHCHNQGWPLTVAGEPHLARRRCLLQARALRLATRSPTTQRAGAPWSPHGSGQRALTAEPVPQAMSPADDARTVLSTIGCEHAVSPLFLGLIERGIYTYEKP